MATYPGGYPTARELFGTTEMTGDYAKIAEGMGAVGITVTDPNQVADAIRQAQNHNAEGRTVLLDIHSDMEPPQVPPGVANKVPSPSGGGLGRG